MSPLKLHLFWAKTIGGKNKLMWRPGKKIRETSGCSSNPCLSRVRLGCGGGHRNPDSPSAISAMAPNSASFCSTAVADMLTEVPVGESAPAMLSGGGCREHQAGDGVIGHGGSILSYELW